MDGIDITVIVYNSCVEGRELVSWLLYTTRVWKGGSLYHGYCIQPVCEREGVWYHGYCINSCVEGRKLVSWLLYTTRA